MFHLGTILLVLCAFSYSVRTDQQDTWAWYGGTSGFDVNVKLEPVNAEPNGTLYVDFFVEHKADSNRVLAFERNGITVQIQSPKPKQSLDDAFLTYIAKVLDVDKKYLSVYKTEDVHKIVRVDKNDLTVDDVMVRVNYEMNLK